MKNKYQGFVIDYLQNKKVVAITKSYDDEMSAGEAADRLCNKKFGNNRDVVWRYAIKVANAPTRCNPIRQVPGIVE
jgi:hypothetical protein